MSDVKVLASKDAEQSVLGSVFFDESVVNIVLDKLKKDDFYYLRHQFIYEAFHELLTQKVPIDVTTVISHLEDKGRLNDCGGSQYLIDLSDSVPSISNIETYIGIVKDKAVQRRVIQACNDIIKDSNNEITDSKAFLDSVEKKVFEATSERRVSQLVDIKTMLDNSTKIIERNSNRKAGTTIGLDTGYKCLNEITYGFQPSELIILAARPSMGKTALALNIASKVAKHPSRPHVVFFSLEMSLDQLALRLLSTESNIDQTALKLGNFNKKDWTRIFFAKSQLEQTNLFFDDSGVVNVQDLRALCRKRKMEGQLDLVIIDYLQLLSSSEKKESRVQEVSLISRVLKEMARELKVPVLALSQLSRDVEKNTDHKPAMSNLRESGSIEQDADIVMFIHRDYYFTKNEEQKNDATLIIAKNRNGLIGERQLFFRPEITAFEDGPDSEERSE